MPKFKKGDQVQLVSGGPPMTVNNPNAAPGGSSTQVDVKWFAGSKMEAARVDEEALKLFVPPVPKATV